MQFEARWGDGHPKEFGLKMFGNCESGLIKIMEAENPHSNFFLVVFIFSYGTHICVYIFINIMYILSFDDVFGERRGEWSG